VNPDLIETVTGDISRGKNLVLRLTAADRLKQDNIDIVKTIIRNTHFCDKLKCSIKSVPDFVVRLHIFPWVGMSGISKLVSAISTERVPEGNCKTHMIFHLFS